MAFVITYTIKDEKGNLSSTEVNLPDGTAWTDVTIFATQMGQAILALITGQITRIGICYQVVLSGFWGTPAAGSDVEEGGRYQFDTAGGYNTALRIPTMSENFIIPGTREVDQSAASVNVFLTAMVDGIDTTPFGGSGIIQPSDKRSDDVDAVGFAREQFQSSRAPR